MKLPDTSLEELKQDIKHSITSAVATLTHEQAKKALSDNLYEQFIDTSEEKLREKVYAILGRAYLKNYFIKNMLPEIVKEKYSKSEEKSEEQEEILSFEDLEGIQKNILIYIYNECKRLKSRITNPIKVEQLRSLSKTTPDSARKSVTRLEKKGFIIRAKYKNGRHGWTKYQLPDHVYHILSKKEQP